MAAVCYPALCFSAKYFGGPNTGGVVCGGAAHVAALAALDFVRFEIAGGGETYRYGRPFKMDRHTIVGVYVALREWMTMDHGARLARDARKVDRLLDELGAPPEGVELAPLCYTLDETLEPTPVNALAVRLPEHASGGVRELQRALERSSPPILTHVIDERLVVVMETVHDDDEALVARALRAALRRRAVTTT